MNNDEPIIFKQDNGDVKLMYRDPNKTQLPMPTKPVVGNKPKVIKQKPKTPGFLQKASKYFFGEEVEDPGKYLWENKIEPAGKWIISNATNEALTMIKHAVQRKLYDGQIFDDGPEDYTSYSNWTTSSTQTKKMPKTYKALAPVKELRFTNRMDAVKVLADLKKIIVNEGAVTVGKYYELSDAADEAESSDYTSGWLNLDSVVDPVESPGGGWILKLPDPGSLAIR